MTRYFTSDLHLGHQFGSDIRGFASVEEHDQAIMDGILDTMTRRDKLFVLGDVAFSRAALMRWIPQVPGVLVLVRGNHDRLKATDYLAAGFNDIIGATKYKEFILTHIPIHPQELPRFRANLHGHVHDGGVTENPTDGRYYNVSVDFNNRRPVPFSNLEGLFPKRTTPALMKVKP
jgi:calcineurin-like phosphoesterase family protein